MLPDSLDEPLRAQIEWVRRIHRKDLAMIYTHVLQRAGGRGVRSPLDAIEGNRP